MWYLKKFQREMLGLNFNPQSFVLCIIKHGSKAQCAVDLTPKRKCRFFLFSWVMRKRSSVLFTWQSLYSQSSSAQKETHLYKFISSEHEQWKQKEWRRRTWFKQSAKNTITEDKTRHDRVKCVRLVLTTVSLSED